uniref:Collagen type XXVI alpha 1 chain n=1 Tax=Rousettus aegyptiacus TaxID=9407 RepID=A0A7J8EY00_ROUAE|nr:collagen type XXVI alpha 1 chain [Rousettus aegyptiacus]
MPLPRKRPHRHWCHHTVTRTVSCQVQNGSETVVQRVYQSCRWPGPCANLVSYRTLIRPTYRVSYRTVTALEWRCCPGFTGSNCDEVRDIAIFYLVTPPHALVQKIPPGTTLFFFFFSWESLFHVIQCP